MLVVLLLILFILLLIGPQQIEGFNGTRMLSGLKQLETNQWGIKPSWSGGSAFQTYNDIGGSDYNYSNYWKYTYPSLVYPKEVNIVQYRPFGHSDYFNVFQLGFDQYL